MVVQQLEPTRKHRLIEKGHEPVAENAWMDEQHGLTGAVDLVLQLDAMDESSIHIAPRRSDVHAMSAGVELQDSQGVTSR
jgi:hypothetical protein